MFTMLLEKTTLQVAYEFNLDKRYSSEKSMLTSIQRIISEVRNDPDKFGVSPEMAKAVQAAIDGRKKLTLSGAHSQKPTIVSQNELLNPEDIKGLTISGRNKAMQLINKKLDHLGKDKKSLDKVGIGELAKVAGILFDKGQIIQGQSTENIAVMSKNIKTDMTPEEAMEVLLNMREVNQAKKEKK